MSSPLQVEGPSCSTPRKRPPTPMKTDLPSSFLRRRQLGAVSAMATHQLTVTHKLTDARDNSDSLPLAHRRKELDTLAEVENSGLASSEVLQDVGSDSGIGDMVLGGKDNSGQLSTDAEMSEKTLPGTAEGMSLTGTVEGMPLSDTADRIPPSGATDRKELTLTVLGMQDEVKSLYIKWCDTFSESESFESFVVQRLDDMLKRAYSLEQDLQDQKAKLRGRLTLLSHTLLGMMDEATDQ